MKSNASLHNTQRIILRSLQYATRARYSELQHAAESESDTFKFHLAKLRKLGYVLKASDGLYELTAEGKAFTERLDPQTGLSIAQPKSSMLLLARCGDFVLAHQRLREPFYEFWGIASAPLLRGVPMKQAAQREFMKQTGIAAEFRPVGSYRMIDVTRGGRVLEDKLFTMLVSDLDRMPTPIGWSGGQSIWLKTPELLQKPRLFPATVGIFEMIQTGVQFREDTFVYREDEY